MAQLQDLVPGMRQVVGAMGRLIEQRIDGEPPFQRDDAFVAAQLERLDRLLAPFRPEVAGLERLPSAGPYLCVGNHSGGIYTPCMWAFLSRWYRYLGLAEPACFLGLDMALALPAVGRIYRRMGALPASAENAAAVFRRGAPLLVYPGGDHEAFRPWRDRGRIDFGGRRGFVTLALAHGVPVIPVTAAGSHETTFVLLRGDRLAASMGLEKIRVKVFPFTLGFPFGLAPGFVPQLPFPSKITIEVGEPLDWHLRYGPEDANNPAVLARCYDEITARMQATLDRLRGVSSGAAPRPSARGARRRRPGSGAAA
jgi:1-acyl-sn-glycerol-3-phosphate acyltransferase